MLHLIKSSILVRADEKKPARGGRGLFGWEVLAGSGSDVHGQRRADRHVRVAAAHGRAGQRLNGACPAVSQANHVAHLCLARDAVFAFGSGDRVASFLQ